MLCSCYEIHDALILYDKKLYGLIYYWIEHRFSPEIQNWSYVSFALNDGLENSLQLNEMEAH